MLHLVSLLGQGVKLMVKELMEKGAACKEDRTVETGAEWSSVCKKIELFEASCADCLLNQRKVNNTKQHVYLQGCFEQESHRC